MTTTPPNERPLSPHLQIYRPQITSILSILHRSTGAFLALASLLLVWWLLSIATGDALGLDDFMASFLGRLILVGTSFSYFYHLCNGVRHLAWDAGVGFDKQTVAKTGWAVVVLSVLMTLVLWLVAL